MIPWSRLVLTLALALTSTLWTPRAGSRAQPATVSAICRGSLICLDQGWTDTQRAWWYTVSQGSRLLPLAWMQALEEPGPSASPPEAFLSAENVARLGYLPNPDLVANPHGLPLGFAVDEDRTRAADLMCDTFPATCDGLVMREKWVGLTCAACHTGEIEVGDRRLRIEGAPGLADFQRLEEDLVAALEETVADRSRFDRFARKVLGADISIETRAGLETQLTENIDWQRKLLEKNESTVRYGHGRLDAQGHILNKVSLVAGVPVQAETVAADAPASYPFVWNTSQQGKIQWNGIANNIFKIQLFGFETDIGALIRNTSEVIGVFAHIEADRGKAYRGYDSSLRLQNLVSMERQLGSLKSPRWPEDLLGPIDWDRAARGKMQFDALKCVTCHQPLAWDDTTSPLKETMSPLTEAGTDIFLACNTFLHRSLAGNFEGQLVFAFKGDPIKERDATRSMLVNATVGAVTGKVDELVGSLFTDVAPTRRDPLAAPPFGGPEFLPGVTDAAKKAQAKVCLTNVDEILAYKARSLNGIWATAPYLHNGSVPTLYDLLLPWQVMLVATDAPATAASADETRPEVFGVGSHSFDPRKVGFRTDPATSPYVFRVRDPVTGEPIPGNYNSGHDYGTSGLTEDQRYDLVEYLKTL